MDDSSPERNSPESAQDISNTNGSDSAVSRSESTHSSGGRELIVVYLKGLAMGTADSVPGVSGGTIALIVGIYERLITALTALDPSVLGHLRGIHHQSERRAFVRSLKAMDVPFLAALGTGMVTAVVALARLVQLALSTVPGPTFAFFFGLIGASALLLGKRRWVTLRGPLTAGIAGFVLAFGIAGASGQGVIPSTLPVVFVAGAIAISGMVLPGISGAFILLLLGQYDYMTATLNGFVDSVINIVSAGITADLLADGSVVVTFLTGAVVGLFTVAYLVRWALDRYRTATLAFLVSLMLGSLRLPVIEMRAATDGSVIAAGPLVVAALVGGGLIYVLNRYTADLEY